MNVVRTSLTSVASPIANVLVRPTTWSLSLTCKCKSVIVSWRGLDVHVGLPSQSGSMLQPTMNRYVDRYIHPLTLSFRTLMAPLASKMPSPLRKRVFGCPPMVKKIMSAVSCEPSVSTKLLLLCRVAF